MSGLSIGKDRALRFCQGVAGFSMPAKTRCWEPNLSGCLIDGLLEPLAGGEGGQGLRVDLDLLAVERAAARARLALARQECPEAHHRDPLSLCHVLDDRVEHRVHRFSGCRFAEIARFGRDLHEIGLGDDMWHSLPPRLTCVASYPNHFRKTMELGTRIRKAFMI